MKPVEDIFGICIENGDLYNAALTHPSYTKENNLAYNSCYERLEFLGDAVLKLLISDMLYEKYPQAPEGEMSKIRSIAVSDNILAQICADVGLDKLIIVASHDEKLGIKKLESVKACAFEAVLGAYYLDGKLSELTNFIKNLFPPYLNEIEKNYSHYNAKAILQEYTQGLDKTIPVYEVVNTEGPAHNRTFTVEVSYNDEVIASGCGKTKKEAEQKAAYEACKKLGAI
ncbi:ribonuclease III [Spirochaetes bacterium]|uniref:Ribonuclease 3 n=1 Tax=Candidatus Scatousia excrementipullorum TaxID=2840936 RepID=A0A9D9GZR7_9BACT|nr:ribonuclease III [Candidatus Scatousia excrementipullorum]